MTDSVTAHAGQRIVVFGDVIDDVVVVPSGPIRSDTDTPSSIRFRAGGSAANTAAWAGSLGAEVDFVGIVGVGDVERHAGLLRAHGVLPRLTAHPTLPTGAIVIIVEGERRAMLTERGANAVLDPESVTDELLENAAVLHLTGYSVFGSDDAAPIRFLITRARALGVEVSVDPGSAGFLADYGVEAFTAVFDQATILFPNLEEGRLLTGLDDPEAVAAALAERYRLVVLTMGAGGVIVAGGAAIRGDAGRMLRVASVRDVVVDPTGAGDAFTAGFLQRWVATGDVVAAAQAGVEVAARAVAIVGGRPS